MAIGAMSLRTSEGTSATGEASTLPRSSNRTKLVSDRLSASGANSWPFWRTRCSSLLA